MHVSHMPTIFCLKPVQCSQQKYIRFIEEQHCINENRNMLAMNFYLIYIGVLMGAEDGNNLSPPSKTVDSLMSCLSGLV